jgi:Sulfatase
MPSAGPPLMTRRSLLEGAAKTSLAAGVMSVAPGAVTSAAKAAGPRAGMNILLIIVDQMRTPWVYMPRKLQLSAIPSVTKLADEGVRFSNFYSSSNDCTPSRTTQATGLYTHPDGDLRDDAADRPQPRVPDVRDDAAAAGVRHLLVREVAHVGRSGRRL